MHHAPPEDAGDRPGEPVDDRMTDRPARTNLFLGASLLVPGKLERQVRVRNLSASGAKIDVNDPPARGSTILLRRGSAKVAAEVVWTEEACCGLRFAEAIDVAGWMSDRPAAVLAQSVGEPTLTDDLALVVKLIERLEAELSSQSGVIAAMGTELQSLDLAGQLLRLAERKSNGSEAPGRRSVRQAAETFLRRPPRPA